MTKKPMSPKHGKKLPKQKRIEELAADDYVDPSHGDSFSESDVFAPQGVTVATSDNESRDASSIRTLARDEEETMARRVEDLQRIPEGELRERAARIGISGGERLSRDELIDRLAHAG